MIRAHCFLRLMNYRGGCFFRLQASRQAVVKQFANWLRLLVHLLAPGRFSGLWWVSSVAYFEDSLRRISSVVALRRLSSMNLFDCFLRWISLVTLFHESFQWLSSVALFGRFQSTGRSAYRDDMPTIRDIGVQLFPVFSVSGKTIWIETIRLDCVCFGAMSGYSNSANRSQVVELRLYR